MTTAIIFDCEFLTSEGAPQRFWCGPHDPDPVIAQIGLVKLDLAAPGIAETARLHVIPRGRDGTRAPLDPLFTRLTGVTEAVLDRDGRPLAEALAEVARFAGDARLWSWGKDEFNMIAISCYVEGLAPPLPVTRFSNACQLLLAAGMPYDDLKRTPSNKLAAYYGIEIAGRRDHDALGDALSVAHVLLHHLREGRLTPAHFA
ncbi:exonuclease [Pseudoroseicyclus tamaricis]|uniref:Exonuclease n=1 Tax=Pseudoroseicyclus tamaricis TaxID=2705421 RepID=A0A6B2JTU1_9RHOB|nr:exonuclease [Pseudoroseicyclus tamaricis]NDV01470.1 exonuclease [Pseudoroseicyclus tamaricis]